MKPIDPRLLRYARATRVFLVSVVALGAVGAGLVIAQAMLLAEVVVGAFQHRMACLFIHISEPTRPEPI